MTLELEPYYQNLKAAKGRSASISVPHCTEMETAVMGSSSGYGPGASGSHSRLPHQSMSGNSRTGSASDFNEGTHYVSRGSAGNMQILNNGGGGGGGAPRPRKSGTHRSQSARIVGHNRPKVKRREHDICEYQQHLDLASSEGAIRDCQDSYNPFISGSTGRLVTSTSLEMSQNSLQQGTPPPGNNMHLSTDAAARDSPVIIRRHSGAGCDRRGSADQKTTPDRERLYLGGYGAAGIPNIVPTIATPEASPHPQRKGMTQTSQQQHQQQQQQQQYGSGNKPAGLPKTPSPSVSRSGSQRRVNSVKIPKKNMDRYLDVPTKDSQQPSPEDEDDEENYRLRTFNVTSKGIAICFIDFLVKYT